MRLSPLSAARAFALALLLASLASVAGCLRGFSLAPAPGGGLVECATFASASASPSSAPLVAGGGGAEVRGK